MKLSKGLAQSITREVQVNALTKGDELNLPKIPSYDWVSHEGREYNTRFWWGNDLEDLAKRVYILVDNIEDYIVNLRICKGNERVCHGWEDFKLDFFFVYACFFTDLFMRISFDDFQTGVLRVLNIVPTQLHSNT